MALLLPLFGGVVPPMEEINVIRLPSAPLFNKLRTWFCTPSHSTAFTVASGSVPYLVSTSPKPKKTQNSVKYVENTTKSSEKKWKHVKMSAKWVQNEVKPCEGSKKNDENSRSVTPTAMASLVTFHETFGEREPHPVEGRGEARGVGDITHKDAFGLILRDFKTQKEKQISKSTKLHLNSF